VGIRSAVARYVRREVVEGILLLAQPPTATLEEVSRITLRPKGGMPPKVSVRD
jgi:hypothetical protein